MDHHRTARAVPLTQRHSSKPAGGFLHDRLVGAVLNRAGSPRLWLGIKGLCKPLAILYRGQKEFLNFGQVELHLLYPHTFINHGFGQNLRSL